jgi:hypothetical protein
MFSYAMNGKATWWARIRWLLGLPWDLWELRKMGKESERNNVLRLLALLVLIWYRANWKT